MRIAKIWPLVTVCIAAYAAPFLASAQQAAQPANAAPPPPRLEKLEEGEAPAITIRKPDGERKIVEKREQGRVTEVKVQTGKSEYTLKANQQAGSALPGDAESSKMRAPQWKVGEFDWGRPKEAKEVDAVQVTTPPPAGSAASSPAKK